MYALDIDAPRVRALPNPQRDGPQVEMPNPSRLMPPPDIIPTRRQPSGSQLAPPQPVGAPGYTAHHSDYEKAIKYYRTLAYADPNRRTVSLDAILMVKVIGRKGPEIIGVRPPLRTRRESADACSY